METRLTSEKVASAIRAGWQRRLMEGDGAAITTTRNRIPTLSVKRKAAHLFPLSSSVARLAGSAVSNVDCIGSSFGPKGGWQTGVCKIGAHQVEECKMNPFDPPILRM